MKKFILVLTFCILLGGCAANNMPDTVSGATENRYRENEIREYEGQRLDPALGPRDNSIKGIQMVDMEKYSLKVEGLVDKPLQLFYEDVKKLNAYTRKITLYCVEGWEASVLWKGARITDIISASGVKKEANTIIFHSVDGYTTSLPLKTVEQKELILAYEANGLPLPAAMGYPFIVVAEEKLGYKWARWVDKIELSADDSYLGYWEQRGYSNDAEIE